MDANRSRVISGTTGIGKSTTVLQMLIMEALTRIIVVLGIEKRALARDFATWCVANSNKVILDDWDDQKRVFPFTVLERTDDRFEREMNKENLRENTIRRRGGGNTDQNPLIETTVDVWSDLVMELDTEIPDAMKLFRRGMIPSDSESAQFWNEIPPHQRLYQLGAAERLLSILKKPTVANRITRDGNKFIDMIEDGYHYVCEGGDVITKSVQRYLCGFRLAELVKYKRSGGTQPLTIVVDESEALGLSPIEATAIQTLRKTDCRFYLICQSASWDD